MSNSSTPNKNVSVILSFTGTAESGFSIDVKVCEDCIPVHQLNNQKIPAVPDLDSLYKEWKGNHITQGRSISRSKRAMEIPDAVVGYSSVDDCLSSAKNLVSYLNQNWFGEDKFKFLKEWIRSRTLLREDNSVPVFFEFRTDSRSQDVLLRRLPWSSWDLFRELPNTEPVLGISVGKPANPLLRNIKVLIILGSDEGGLDLEADENFVSELSKVGAQVKRLSCPDPEVLYSELKKNSYDIFFFAGHSLSEEDQRDGTILLKPDTLVPIDLLIESLRTASKKGLKLAIFNSCDGLGLADTLLINAKIPSVLVFREPVPDEVARKFLQCFLEEFSSGKPLFLSVREARHRLRFLEIRTDNPLPSASWLPAICQNSSQSEIFLEPTESIALKSSLGDSTQENNSQPHVETGSHRQLWKAGVAALSLTILSLAGWGISRILAPESSSSTPTVASDSAISQGSRLLLDSEINASKIKGVDAYRDKDWDGAIAAFRESLEVEKNDPESWIYLNNAIAEKNASKGNNSIVRLAIATSIPEDEDDLDGQDEQGVAKELLRGVALRQAEFNCGVEGLVSALENTNVILDCKGTRESFVHFTIADDLVPEIDPIVRAEEVANLLAKEEDIIAVIGHFSSDLCREAGKIYGKNNIVMISPTCTATDLTSEDWSLDEFFFRTVPNDAVAATRLFNEVSADGRRVAVAYVHGNGYSESFKQSFGEGLAEQKYIHECNSISKDFDDSDAFQCATEAGQREADFLLLIPTSSVRKFALPILENLDDSIIPLGSDSVYNSEVIENYGREAADAGLQIYISWLPDPNSKTDFEQEAKRLFSTDGFNWRTQSTYDAISAVTQGIQDILVLGKEISGENLKDTLRDPYFAADGVVGPDSVKFDSNGDRNLNGLDDKIGVVVQVEEYLDRGATKHRFTRVDEDE